MNNITIIGRLTRDPEYTARNGDKSQYTKFTVAVDNEYGDLASFFDCITFGNQADNVDKYLRKGRQVGVRGRMEQGEQYTDKNGNKRRSWTLRAERVEFLGSKNDQSAEQIEKKANDLFDIPDSFEQQEEDVPF